jgi:hypothetical protein
MADGDVVMERQGERLWSFKNTLRALQSVVSGTPSVKKTIEKLRFGGSPGWLATPPRSQHSSSTPASQETTISEVQRAMKPFVVGKKGSFQFFAGRKLFLRAKNHGSLAERVFGKIREFGLRTKQFMDIVSSGNRPGFRDENSEEEGDEEKDEEFHDAQ